MSKPADWPRYMIAKPLKGGFVAYYWNPHKRDLQDRFPLGRQALGTDYGLARVKCDGDPRDENDRGLNGFLDAWRASKGEIKDLDLMPSYGAVDWWFERYFRSDAFLSKVSDRSKPDYRKALKKIADIAPTKPLPGITRIGQLPAKSITPALPSASRRPGRQEVPNRQSLHRHRKEGVARRAAPLSQSFPRDQSFRGLGAHPTPTVKSSRPMHLQRRSRRLGTHTLVPRP
jgi:hypothetical protein